MGYFGKIIKNTATFAIVGALLALAAPTVAGLLGLDAVALGLINTAGAFTLHSAPLWTGAFFGAFGGIHAAVEPLMEKLTSKPKSHHMDMSHFNAEAGVHPHFVPSIAQDVAPETSKFRDMVGATRATDLSFQDRVTAAEAAPKNLTIH